VYRNLKNGFTLVELLIVIAIIALLAGLILASYQEARRQARDDKRKADVQQIALALRLYYEKYGEFPCEAGGSACNFTGNANGEIGNGGTIDGLITPFLTKSVADPLGPGDTTYLYYYDGDTDCGGTPQAAVHAINMEIPVNGNWSAVCGGPDVDGGANSNTYTVFVGNSSG